MTQTELSLLDLNERIRLGGTVRADHVWSYIKVSGSRLADRNHAKGLRLRTLLDAGAIVEALLLLADEGQVAGTLRVLHRSSDGWACSAARVPSARLVKATHSTLEGAIFLTLLKQSISAFGPAFTPIHGARS